MNLEIITWEIWVDVGSNSPLETDHSIFLIESSRPPFLKIARYAQPSKVFLIPYRRLLL